MCLIWDRFICFYAQRLEHVQTLANGYQTTCCQVELLFAVHWKCETFCVAVACSMEWVESCVHECVSCRLIPKIVGTSQWSSVRYDHWWKISCTGADQWMSERCPQWKNISTLSAEIHATFKNIWQQQSKIQNYNKIVCSKQHCLLYCNLLLTSRLVLKITLQWNNLLHLSMFVRRHTVLLLFFGWANFRSVYFATELNDSRRLWHILTVFVII